MTEEVSPFEGLEEHEPIGEDEGATPVDLAEQGPEEGYEVGQTVRHPTFGRGEVIVRSGAGGRQTILVKFQSVGVKRLMVQYAKLEKV